MEELLFWEAEEVPVRAAASMETYVQAQPVPKTRVGSSRPFNYFANSKLYYVNTDIKKTRGANWAARDRSETSALNASVMPGNASNQTWANKLQVKNKHFDVLLIQYAWYFVLHA